MKAYSGIALENNNSILGTITVPSNSFAQKFRLPFDYARGGTYPPSLTGFQLFVESDASELEVVWSLQHTFNRRNEVQEIQLNGLPNDRSYTLAFLGAATEAIAHADSGEGLAEKLNNLTTIQGNVEVLDRRVTFVSTLGKTNVEMLKVVDIEGYTIKGEWEASASYSTDDVVSRLGNNYRAVQSSTGQDPVDDTSGVYWQLTVSVTEAIPAYQWQTVANGTQASAVVQKNNRGWLDVELDEDFQVAHELLQEEWRIIFRFAQPVKICFSAFQNDKGPLTRANESDVLALNNKTSSIYRVLSASLDEGIDALGNNFRTAVKRYEPKSIVEKSDQLWMSNPNPSKFAVESLYFDIRQSNQASVVNKVLIDPVTPGIFCNVYYSTDDSNSSNWDMKLWTPALTNLKLGNKYTYNFPDPVTAKYIKLEFTQLQARSYIVGNYQPKVYYNKHPKWVLDYFYKIYLEQKDRDLPTDQVTLKYNALDLYYNYFIDDIVEFSTLPRSIDKSITTDVFNDYLSLVTKQEMDNLDPQTLREIRPNIAMYTQHPFFNVAGSQSIVNTRIGSELGDYSTELVVRPIADVDLVSAEDRESVKMDREFPPMNFYIPARHSYKLSKAQFENDKAYFAGIKQVAFQRNYYASWSDEWVYSETAGDETNLEFNDLKLEDGAWTGKGLG